MLWNRTGERKIIIWSNGGLVQLSINASHCWHLNKNGLRLANDIIDCIFLKEKSYYFYWNPNTVYRTKPHCPMPNTALRGHAPCRLPYAATCPMPLPLTVRGHIVPCPLPLTVRGHIVPYPLPLTVDGPCCRWLGGVQSAWFRLRKVITVFHIQSP